jgi:hypothetical protein
MPSASPVVEIHHVWFASATKQLGTVQDFAANCLRWLEIEEHPKLARRLLHACRGASGDRQMRSSKNAIVVGILALGMCVLGTPEANAQNQPAPPSPGYYDQGNQAAPYTPDPSDQDAYGPYDSNSNGQDYGPYNDQGPAPNYAPPANGPGYYQTYSSYGPPPSCPYGYFPSYPYGCAPYGYWGPQYFYNGIFVGVGPWFGWGWGPSFLGFFHDFASFRLWGGFRGTRFNSFARGGGFHGFVGGGFRGGEPAFRGNGGFRGVAPGFRGGAPAVRGGRPFRGGAPTFRGGAPGARGGGFRGGEGGFHSGGRSGGSHGGGHSGGGHGGGRR